MTSFLFNALKTILIETYYFIFRITFMGSEIVSIYYYVLINYKVY